MSSHGSITTWARQLGDADRSVRNAAAREIWERYSPQLLALVRQNLAMRIRRREDEDDVLQSVFKSFCQNQKEDGYALKSRDEVWALLFQMAIYKARNTANRHRAACRDVAREQRGPVEEAGGSLGSQWLLEHIAEKFEPDPATVAELNDYIESLLRRLTADLRQIVLWKLEGYTHREIAAMIHRTERLVELRWQLICQRLKREADSAS